MPSGRKLGLAFVNLVPAVAVMMIAAAHWYQFAANDGIVRIGTLLLILQQVLASFFFIARNSPSLVSWRPLDVLLALGGTFAPSFYSVSQAPRFETTGIFFQMLGSFLSLYALVSLGKSLGIIPANRGIQSNGMYRFVRHPLYFSYLIANFGFLLSHFNLYNLSVSLLALICQLYRIFAEEKLLLQDSAYAEYTNRVRWRLVPYVF